MSAAAVPAPACLWCGGAVEPGEVHCSTACRSAQFAAEIEPYIEEEEAPRFGELEERYFGVWFCLVRLPQILSGWRPARLWWQ